jgi:tRNA(Ile)-lysidine synthase
LDQRVLAKYRSLDLAPAGPIAVAFSGGTDSLALLAVLAGVRPWLGRDVVPIHVDHRLRPTSHDDATQAASLAARLGFDQRTVDLLPDLRSRHPGVGLEEAARRERYLALARMVQELAAVLLCVAHHQADQAETVLLHLLRGAGLDGAAGMAERTDLQVPWWESGPSERVNVELWRPLLDEPRSELRRFVANLGLTPIEDESNADQTLRRNATRHRALPCLEAVVPEAGAALARFARLAADDDAVLDRLADGALSGARTESGGLQIASLLPHPVAIQRRVIRQWIAERAIEVELSADRVEAVRLLAAGRAGNRRIEIGGNATVVRWRGMLRLALGWAAEAVDGPR